MSIAGKWIFHFSWGCNGNYIQDEVVLNPDGTFVDGWGVTDNWVEAPGMMELQYSPPLRTNYSGNVQGSAMVGISTTFAGFQGCWYAIREDVRTSAKAERVLTHDLAGHELS
jgi:hypothetical protein